MCGRARCCISREGILSRFPSVKQWNRWNKYQPMNNMSPGAVFPVIHTNSSGEIVVTCMRWGLIPSFTSRDVRPDFFRLFNARSETVAEKASFRRLLPARRCVVLLDGFYEWVKSRDGKQPYYIYSSSSTPLYVACLYDTWHSADEEDEVYSFTILTAPPNSEAMAQIHDRMPLILTPSQAEEWIAADLTDETPKELLDSIFEQHTSTNSNVSMHAVTSRMNHASYQSDDCIAPLTSQQTTISSFFSPKKKRKTEVAESKTEADK